MTALASGAAGLAVALSVALLCAPRIGSAAALCALQAVVVVVAAVAQGHPWVAALELTFAAAIPLGVRLTTPGLPVMGNGRHPIPPTRVTSGLAVGAILALVAATLPGAGLPLAAVLLGATLVAVRRSPPWQVLGFAALQNGVVLAAIGSRLSEPELALAVLPVLPALTIAGLSLGTGRAATAWPAGRWIDATVCTAALVLACLLPWQVPIHVPPLRLDAFAAHLILVLAIVGAAASWARCLRPASATIPGARLVLLAGASLAVVSDNPMLTWLALTIATMATFAAALPRWAEAWRRLRLGALGLGIALFGTIGLLGTGPPAPAATCAAVGIGALALLAPELALTAVAVILRQRGPDILLLTAGLAALAIGGLGLWMRPNDHRLLPLAGLGQGGVAVFAFGLGSPDASFAGVLHLTLLALTQSAVLLARDGGLDRVASLAGLAGLPPFGMFASLVLILTMTAARSHWLLLPLVAGLALLAWPILARLPPLRPTPGPWQRQLAWIPLLLLLVAGFAMPAPIDTWLHAVTAGVR